MPLNDIAAVIKSARNNCGYSAQYVVTQLLEHEIKISETTLYGYENGVSRPSANTLMALCVIYGINDVLGTFGFQSSPGTAPQLSAEAQRIAVLYENATDLQKTIVRTTLEYDAKPKRPPLPTPEETAAELEELSFQNPLRAMIRDESS